MMSPIDAIEYGLEWCSPKPRPPGRRVRLVVDCHGDDLSDIVHILEDLVDDLSESQTLDAEVTAGSDRYGFSWALATDPDITAESYRAALEEWRQARIGLPLEPAPEDGDDHDNDTDDG